MDVDDPKDSKDKRRVQYKSYAPAKMEEAMAAVHKDGKTMYRAAKEFGVPMNTLRDRLIAKGVLKPRRPALFPKETVPAKQTRLSKDGGKPHYQITVEKDMMERWQGIGKSEGLTTDAAITRFLVSLYYDEGKGEDHKADIRCRECHSPLCLFCVHCQLISPSSPAVLKAQQLGAGPRDTAGEPADVKTEQDNLSTAVVDTASTPRRSTKCGDNRKPCAETEMSSEDSQSGWDEDHAVSEHWPQMDTTTKNGNSSDNRGDTTYSLDDLIIQLEEHSYKNHRGKAYECPQCGEAFLDPVDLQQHLADTKHNPEYICKLCSKSFKNKSALQQHRRVHNRQDHQCPTCGLSFKFPSRLNKHLKTHGTDRPHVCDKCGKSFVSVYYLRDHIKIHSEERRYKCDLCDAAFKQKPALYAHGKKHTNEKPFQCQYCGLKFRDSQKVKIHVRTHTGEKPYQCGICEARFVSNSNMWQHCAYVHGKSTKSHQCPHCSLTFAAKGKLKVHLKNAHSGAEGESRSCELEDMTDMRQTVQPFCVELPTSNSSALASMGTLCHVSM